MVPTQKKINSIDAINDDVAIDAIDVIDAIGAINVINAIVAGDTIGTIDYMNSALRAEGA